MALTTGELTRLRYELGYNVLGVQAEPYVTYFASLDRVVTLYLSAGAVTSSSTVVAAATTPTPVTLTLASATGFALFDNVVIDVDARQEKARVETIVGSTITVILSKAHTGTYPVTVEGGESIIRELLQRCREAADKIGTSALSAAGIKKVDEIEFFGDQKGTAQFDKVSAMLRHWRNELASALGVVNLREHRRGEINNAVAY